MYKDIEKLAGRVIVAGFDGTSAPDHIVQALEQDSLAGIILFKRNVESTEQVASLNASVKAVAKDTPVIIGVDQEGGRVIRIRDPLVVLPAARKFGEIDDPTLTELASRLVGNELRALGFTLNFAPVIDVDTNPDSPIIGDRSYGGTPDIVIRHGLAFARGMRDGGIMPCAKHFPGHGDAQLDSHLALPRVDHDLKRLEQIEMAPFDAWARTGIGPIMTAHIIFSALDPEIPATLSRKILKTQLRERLRFRGPVFSDDLEMGAIAKLGGAGAVAVRAIKAGVDGLLICRSQEIRASVIAALSSEAIDDANFAQRLKVAAMNLVPLALPPGPSIDAKWIESEAHRNLKQEVSMRLNKTNSRNGSMK
jgi:beta-N-acetylhexosaminidase